MTLTTGCLRQSLFTLLLLLGGSLHGQQHSRLPVGLDPKSRSEFWIDANEAVVFTLQTERRDLRLRFEDPKGKAWEIIAPGKDPLPTYETRIDRPSPGLWSLSVRTPSAVQGRPTAYLQITYTNRVQARLSAPKQALVVGESLPVSLELMDGIARVKNLTSTVSMTQLGNPRALPAFVIFHDDGSNGDRIAKDGMYTARIPATTPGRFRLEAHVEGLASTGRFHRTMDLIYKVAPKAAQITRNVSQRHLIKMPD